MDFVKEVATRTDKLEKEKFNLETKFLKAKKEIKRLNERNASNINASIREMITIDNISHLINKTRTFDGSDVTSQRDKPPQWFQLVIEYWNDRHTILDIFEFFDIKFPEWAREMKMPHEWNKEELLYSIKTIGNHYVCNGQIYSGNIGFWFNEYRGSKVGEYWTNPKKMMDHQYSEIPWQFLLRNPLWLNDKDVFNAMLSSLEDGSSNAFSFTEIGNYQKIEEKQFKKILTTILKSDNSREYMLKFVRNNIGKVQITKKDKELITFACNNHIGAVLSNSCDIIHEHFVRTHVEKLNDKIDYVEKCDKFDLATKAELIKEFVLEKYSNKITAKELLEA